MKDYIIWTDEYGNEMVEVLNKSDIQIVQHELLAKDYIIIALCKNCFGKPFMKVEKVFTKAEINK